MTTFWQAVAQILMEFLKPEVMLPLLVIVIVTALLWHEKLPTMADFVTLCNAVNTRGGNILLLSIMVVLFTTTAMKYTYFIVGLEVAGKLTKESALAMNGFTFITGGVTGLALGAWLKAMSPQDMPVSPGASASTTTSVVSSASPVVPAAPIATPAQPTTDATAQPVKENV